MAESEGRRLAAGERTRLLDQFYNQIYKDEGPFGEPDVIQEFEDEDETSQNEETTLGKKPFDDEGKQGTLMQNTKMIQIETVVLRVNTRNPWSPRWEGNKSFLQALMLQMLTTSTQYLSRKMQRLFGRTEPQRGTNGRHSDQILQRIQQEEDDDQQEISPSLEDQLLTPEPLQPRLDRLGLPW